MIRQASVIETNDRLASGECQVIDVREYSEFDRERIADARLVPLSAFEKHVGSIDRSKPVYIMCRTGNRAKQAADRLAANGFTDVHVIEGGMVSWAAADLPVIKGDSKVWALERQVRFASGSLVLLGLGLGVLVTPYFYILSAFIGAGLVFSAATDTCAMGMMLAKMPWNQAPAGCEPQAAKPAKS